MNITEPRQLARSIAILAIYSLHPVFADAAIIPLRGTADGSSAYFEESSGSFFQMDLYDPQPRQTQQRFRDINNPSITFGSLQFDGFPNDENFQLGYVGFDDSTLINETGTATINELVFSITNDPLDPGHVNYGRWSEVFTRNVVIDPTSRVTFVNGIITSIDLQSTMSLEIFPFPPTPVSYLLPGYFNITGHQFEGYFAAPLTPGNLDTEVIYDFRGTITSTIAIPEPSSLTFLAMGLTALGLGPRRRTRRNAKSDRVSSDPAMFTQTRRGHAPPSDVACSMTVI